MLDFSRGRDITLVPRMSSSADGMPGTGWGPAPHWQARAASSLPCIWALHHPEPDSGVAGAGPMLDLCWAHGVHKWGHRAPEESACKHQHHPGLRGLQHCLVLLVSATSQTGMASLRTQKCDTTLHRATATCPCPQKAKEGSQPSVCGFSWMLCLLSPISPQAFHIQ